MAALKGPPYDTGFRARQSSELPAGLLNNRSHTLSRYSAPLKTAFTGAFGTVISRLAPASGARPRHRYRVRTRRSGITCAQFV